MSGSVRISEKHGVNPSLLFCPVCGADGGIALLGKLPGDEEAPRKMSDREPCKKCCDEIDGHSKNTGMVIIVMRDEAEKLDRKKQSPWPYFVSYHVMKWEASDRIFGKEARKTPVQFMTYSDAKKLELPVPEIQ